MIVGTIARNEEMIDVMTVAMIEETSDENLQVASRYPS